MNSELIKQLEESAGTINGYCEWCGWDLKRGGHNDTCAVTVAHGFVARPAKHPVNEIVAAALESLAKQVRESDNDVTELGSIGGRGCLIDDIEHLENSYFIARFFTSLTPPPAGNGQNVAHSNDDDRNDGAKP